LNLTIGTKPEAIEISENICFGETFTWEVTGTTYNQTGTYTKNNDGCTADQVLKLTIGTKPEAIEISENICFGETFTWEVTGTTYNQTGTYIKNNDGCTADQVLKLNVLSAINISTVPNSIIPEFCIEDNNGSFKIKISGGSPPYSVSLNNSSYEQISGTEHIFTELAAGSYIAYVKDALECNTKLEVDIPNPISINPVALVNYSCINNSAENSVTITVDSEIINPTDIDYSLDGVIFQPSNVFRNIAPGTHRITARHANGCEQTTLPFIIDDVQPLALTLANKELNEIVATATGGVGGYQYTFEGEDYNSVNKFIIYKSGTYTITVTDKNGCTVSVSKYFEYIDVCISNYFTPNGDGINDEWGPDCTINYRNLTYTIFDRYGRVIGNYKYGQKWDGKYNGTELPSGDYWYVFKLNDTRDNREFVGYFTLYR
jgi:gliding motility-associated-like protein